MRDLVNLLLSFAVVFGASVAIAFAAGAALRRWRRPFVPQEGAKMRVRSGDAIYRCRFIGEGTDGWAFTAPLQRDRYIPLAIGQQVSCEVTTEAGVMVFTTRVKGRRADPPAIVLAPPRQVSGLNRRSSERKAAEGRTEVSLDGLPGVLLDVSRGGARVRMRGKPPVKGSRIGIRLPGGDSMVADVLESEPSMGGAVLRLRFHRDLEEAS